METVVKQKVKFNIDIEVELEINLEEVQSFFGLYKDGEIPVEFDKDFRMVPALIDAINKFTEEVVINLEIDSATGFKVITRQVEDVYNVHTRF